MQEYRKQNLIFQWLSFGVIASKISYKFVLPSMFFCNLHVYFSRISDYKISISEQMRRKQWQVQHDEEIFSLSHF